MKEKKQILRNRILIVFSGVLTLMPSVYWCITEGQQPMYQESSFFPHYFIMLMISVAVAVSNCLINRKIIKDKFLCIMECTVGGLIAIAFAAVMISVNVSWKDGFGDFVAALALNGYLICLYEIVLCVIHVIIELLLSKILKRFLSLTLCICISSAIFAGNVYAADMTESTEELAKEAEQKLLADYEDYQGRLRSVTEREDIEKNGFRLIESQIFPLETKQFGEVFLLPAIEKKHCRLALFLAREDGTIVYRTDKLEVNNWNKGQMWQPVRNISAVSFQDLNKDNMTDIVLIITCVNKEGDYKGIPYKVGDVLFQAEEGFYRDYRISDKINRFDMNKSAESIAAFVRDGYSTEFLYTADTKADLIKNRFKIATEQCYKRQFEKLGMLEVVPGTYTIAEFSHFMIYLVNEQGSIVWSLQPMGTYDNLYSLKGVKCMDLDGDGLKDIFVLARYSSAGRDNELVIETDYSVYYQRTGGFEEDKEIKLSVKVAEGDTVNTMIEKVKSYWGWSDT